jgi:glycosyltransferase involved in cell wall biosynthesis
MGERGTTPAVSVVMPAYNRERYVGEAIESVLAQTFSDFELIVVDDGSTDATPQRVASLRDPRIRLLRREHRGISAAMNAGLRTARGAYVARLDSDDVWLPALLATQVAVLESRLEVGVVYARAQGMEADGTLTTHVWGVAPRYPRDSLRSLLHGDCTCNITVVARRECLERAGLYDESLGTNEDWDLWLRVARHCRFAFTDRVLARFRWHEGNVTGPRSPRFAETLGGRTRVLDKAFAAPDLPSSAAAMKAVAYRNVHTGVGLLWLGAREYGAALHAFGRALRDGGNPVPTLVRIAWFVLNWEFLSRRAWGRRFIDWQSRTRLRWRARGGRG